MPVVINFEDRQDEPYIINEYENYGIRFNNLKIIDYSKDVAPWRYQGFAHSGTKAVEQCYGKEFCTTPIAMDFIEGQKRVKLWVGYSATLARQKTVIMRAFDSSSAQVGQTTAILQPSDKPIPIQTPLEIISSSANIKRVTVNFAPDANGNSYPNHLAVDDIEYDTKGPAPECETVTAPTVMILRPTSGQVTNYNGFELQCIISSPYLLKSATLYVSGPHGGTNSMNLFSSSSFPRNGFGTYDAGISGMLFPADPAWNDNDATNTIKVRVENCAGFGESSTTVKFEPCQNPAVTITDPNPARPAGDVIISSLDPSFELKGNINSPTKLERITVVVTSALQAGRHQFDISPSDDGTFDQQIDPNTYLFPGRNTITVIATDSKGCSGAASTNVVFEKSVLKRISGESCFQLDKKDERDTSIAKDGFLYVLHDPGCGIIGNDGNDKFFDKSRLPVWCKLQSAQLKQFWPQPSGTDDPFGGCSYLIRFQNENNLPTQLYPSMNTIQATLSWNKP